MRQILTAAIVAAIWSTASAAPAQTTPAPAQHAESIMDKAINVPGTSWTVHGVNQHSEALTDDGVPGARFFRVTVTARGVHARDAVATSPIQKPIAAGDTILVAIYLRAPELRDGETMPLPYIGASSVAPPYDGLVANDVTISNKWKIYYASGKAGRNIPGGEMNAAVHLASDKHVIDLGPVFVLDFGQNYAKRLPDNSTPQ